MKPAPFEYFAPANTAEAIDLLHQWGSEAKVLSGGQSLMPMLNFRLLKPAALIDINAIGDLSSIQLDNAALTIGAGTRQSSVLASSAVVEECGLITEALAFVSHPAIRNRGTIGGSVAHADPSAELAVVAAAAEAQMKVQSARGERVLAAEDFFVDALATALEPDELLTEIRFPKLSGRTGWGFQEVSRRRGDFAVVNAAALVSLDNDGRCQKARIVVGGVSGTPLRLKSLEAGLVGSTLDPRTLADVAEQAKDGLSPQSDVHASAEYRRDVAAVLIRRSLETAAERARNFVQD